MNLSKQTWLVVALTVGLAASLGGNWYLWRGLTGWLEFQAGNELISTQSEARMVMVTQRLFEEGDEEGVRKHLGFMLEGQIVRLKAVIEYDTHPRRREKAADILASIEDGSILDVFE